MTNWAGRRLLIVGATGVLRPAGLSVAASGGVVVAVARDSLRLNELADVAGRGLIPLSLDVFDAEAVADALRSGPLAGRVDSAILYLAAGDDQDQNAAADRLGRCVDGPTLRILTSRWTPVGAPDLAAGRWPRVTGRSHLLLGRTGQPVRDPVDGQPADGWHTPAQISRAALVALGSGADSMLGDPVPATAG